jgi:DNA processing protein
VGGVSGEHPADDEAPWLLALCALAGMGPRRLTSLLGSAGPEAVVRWLADDPGVDDATSSVLRESVGSLPPDVVGAWRRSIREADGVAGVHRRWERHRRAGVHVWRPAHPDWPAGAFVALDQPPPLLCARGDRSAASRPTAAIVGTRACTRYGADVAGQLGAQLASAGVSVVSGLALGIDAAAHRGVLEAGGAPPIGVVASGLDVVYPRRNRDLWDQVGAVGLLLSEHPLGVRPVAWQFPARNRIIAALADVVVVVESHGAGGALHTAAASFALGRTVLAVPGSVRSPASEGTNRLLGDGASPCLGVADVLSALGMAAAARADPFDLDAGPAPLPGQRAVLEALGAESATAEQLMVRSGLPLDEVVVSLQRLAIEGLVGESGGWYEAIDRRR